MPAAPSSLPGHDSDALHVRVSGTVKAGVWGAGLHLCPRRQSRLSRLDDAGRVGRCGPRSRTFGALAPVLPAALPSSPIRDERSRGAGRRRLAAGGLSSPGGVDRDPAAGGGLEAVDQGRRDRAAGGLARERRPRPGRRSRRRSTRGTAGRRGSPGPASPPPRTVPRRRRSPARPARAGTARHRRI